jgi:hypothetical protein
MTTRKSRRQQAAQEAAPPPLQMPDRRLMEQQMAAIGRLLEGHEFASLDEANAYLQEVLSRGGLPPAAPSTPLEEA